MDLCGEEIRGYLVNRGYAGGVLGSQGGYVQGSGICGIAAVSALFSAEDVKEAAQRLKADVLEIMQKND